MPAGLIGSCRIVNGGGTVLKIHCHRLALFMQLAAASEADASWFPSEPHAALHCLRHIRFVSPQQQQQQQRPPPLDLSAEWNRILQDTHGPWRFSSGNADYSLCPTYPASLPVPAQISDTVLHHAAQFRIRQRFSLLSYVTGRPWCTVLLRSSQPLVGLTGRRCIQDEKLIEAFKAAARAVDGAVCKKLLIVDARPTTSALANTVIGAGVERLEFYEGAERVYLSLDNIHAVRDTHRKLTRALKRQKWQEGESQSGWLDQLQKILEGVKRILHALPSSHVLVHCSDGWDRTTQLVSLVQLCVDPFYRTVEGFRRLVAKDWLRAGHRFADRNHHLLRPSSSSSIVDDEEAACPIFLQFIEVTVQLCRQYPLHFSELTDAVLLEIVDAAQAGRGEFFGNCEADRGSTTAAAKPNAIKEEIPGHLPGRSSSRVHSGSSSEEPRGKREEKLLDPLLPHCEREKMILWPAYYKRYQQ